jgi:hypothetical protein
MFAIMLVNKFRASFQTLFLIVKNNALGRAPKKAAERKRSMGKYETKAKGSSHLVYMVLNDVNVE